MAQTFPIIRHWALKVGRTPWAQLMQLPFQFPDDVERRALEAFALEELRAGRITEPQLRETLGLARIQLDGFLKSQGIYQDYSLEDFEQERQALIELGF